MVVMFFQYMPTFTDDIADSVLEAGYVSETALCMQTFCLMWCILVDPPRTYEEGVRAVCRTALGGQGEGSLGNLVRRVVDPVDWSE